MSSKGYVPTDTISGKGANPPSIVNHVWKDIKTGISTSLRVQKKSGTYINKIVSQDDSCIEHSELMDKKLVNPAYMKTYLIL
jgi:hypothetical protein